MGNAWVKLCVLHVVTFIRLLHRLSYMILLQCYIFPCHFIGCPTGYYGNVCVYKCGFCATGTTCNISNGMCDNGCDVGYTGLQCLDRKFCKVNNLLNIFKMFPLPLNTIQLISLA